MWREIARLTGLFLLLAALVLAATWPWPRQLASGLPDHWDPPLHATKLVWNAEHIGRGQVLGPDPHLNSFYPFSYALYFDDLFWIPSLAGFAVYALTGSAVLLYNLTFVAFWALSGVAMYAFLRELGWRDNACVFGAAAFCLMPYRTSYYVELNMQLVFGIPLCLLFLLRLVRAPGLRPALGLALSFWAQAVSALYYAVILAVALPLVGLGLLGRHRQRWRDRRLAVWAGVALGLGLGLVGFHLWPYYELYAGAGMRRQWGEALRHSLQPLSYLVRGERAGDLVPALGRFPARRGEMIVFPGVTVLTLAMLHGLAHQRLLRPAVPAESSRWGVALHWGRAGSLTVATLACVLAYGAAPGSAAPPAGALLEVALWGALASSVVIALRGEGGLAGLAAAAVLGFVLSLGPEVTAGEGIALFSNRLYRWLYDAGPVLAVIRVSSRFSILVLVFLVVAAAGGVHWLGTRFPRKRWVIVVLILGVLAESWVGPYAYRAMPLPPRSPVFARLEAMPDRHSLAVLPMGERREDSRYMLYATSLRHHLVNGWSGFMPPSVFAIVDAFARGRSDEGIARLRELWPDPLILVDRPAMRRYASARFGFYPSGVNVPAYATAETDVARASDLLEADESFALYRPRMPEGPIRGYQRIVRADVRREAPVVVFEARHGVTAADDAWLALAVNDLVAGRVPVSRDWREIRVALPPERSRPSGDVVTIDPVPLIGDPASWEIRRFRLVPADGEPR